MATSKEIKIRADFLKIQRDNLLKRYDRILKREAFVKRNKRAILVLSMDGWPRLTNMKDRHKWIHLVYKAKIEGIYSIGTSNCDVIAQLERYAKANKK